MPVKVSYTKQILQIEEENHLADVVLPDFITINKMNCLGVPNCVFFSLSKNGILFSRRIPNLHTKLHVLIWDLLTFAEVHTIYKPCSNSSLLHNGKTLQP